MKTDKKTWLVTGGCGFLGTALIEKLLRDGGGAGIRVLDNLTGGGRDDLAEVADFREVSRSELTGPPEGVELVVGDVREQEDCLASATGVDTVVHFAASTGIGPSVKDPRYDMLNNVLGVFNVLEAARLGSVKRFVFASSGAPVGEVEPPITESKAPKPVSPYGASKLAGEGYCSAYYGTFGLGTVALRFGNVYGPRSKHKSSVVARFFKMALAGKALEVYGDGEQTRDFIFIDDLLRAVTLSAGADVGGEVFQIATHRETTVNEIAARVGKMVSAGSGRQVELIHSEALPGEVRRNYSDISKAREMLGWEPEVALDKGLLLTYEYFKRGVS